MAEPKKIHSLFWLWLPVIILLVQIALEIALPQHTLSALLSEGGPHELLQFFLMTAAFFVGLSILPQLDWKSQKLLGLWILIATAASFYVAGEEMSWGQQLLHWTTPEFWSVVNDQNETNLHNTSSWFDQKPRLLLEIGVLTGGLIFPLLRRYKPGFLPQKFAIIYPPDIFIVTTLMALTVNIVDRIDDNIKSIVFFERASEVEELYLFYFVLLYLIVLRLRIMALKNNR